MSDAIMGGMVMNPRARRVMEGTIGAKTRRIKWKLGKPAVIVGVIIFLGLNLYTFTQTDRIQKDRSEAKIIRTQTLEIEVATLPDAQVKQKTEARSLQTYLEAESPSLAILAPQIANLPRWREVVGIIGKETNYCTKGVGVNYNNCGAIKNSKTGLFKRYASVMDSIEDLSILLQKPLYKNLRISQMNGIFCQSVDSPNKRCLGWDRDINIIISNL